MADAGAGGLADREKVRRLKTRGKDQALELRIVPEQREVLVVLGAQAQVRLQLKRALQGFERGVNRA